MHYNLINATGINIVVKIHRFSYWLKSNCMQFTKDTRDGSKSWGCWKSKSKCMGGKHSMQTKANKKTSTVILIPEKKIITRGKEGHFIMKAF